MEKGTKQGLVNLYHMTLIAKAEYATLKSKPSQVEQCKAAFDEAVSVSTRSGFTQHAALTNELTARFMLRSGDNDWGTHYIKMATKGYQDWGAHGKVEQLRGEFHHLQASFRRAKRGSVGIRGRSRFEEADHDDLYKGLKSRDELWSIAISDCSSDDDGVGASTEGHPRRGSYGRIEQLRGGIQASFRRAKRIQGSVSKHFKEAGSEEMCEQAEEPRQMLGNAIADCSIEKRSSIAGSLRAGE